jgi:hypothetical protein
VGVGTSTRRVPAASPTTGFAGVVTAGANEFVAEALKIPLQVGEIPPPGKLDVTGKARPVRKI